MINCVPELYQTLEWKLSYSNTVHGTSFQNLLRRAENEAPFILVIQDEHGFVFGAYGSEKLRYTTDFFGTGETFLFTFRVIYIFLFVIFQLMKKRTLKKFHLLIGRKIIIHCLFSSVIKD